MFFKPNKHSKLKFPTPMFIGFLQATGLAIYVVLISLFFNFIVPKFDKMVEQFYAPIIMLLLFTTSAVICATMVLGRSAVLFWEKKYKECFVLLGCTVLWMLFYFTAFASLFVKSK